MREDDSDIDDLIAGKAPPPKAEQLELVPAKPARRARGAKAPHPPAVDTLSAQLRDQLAEIEPPAPVATKWVGPEGKAFDLGEHLAATPWPARLLPDLDADAYHERPGLSSSCAGTLIAQSALHAWAEHPSFGRGRDASKSMDRGAVVHKLVLGKGKDFAVLDFEHYKTNAAKAARDAARAAGLIPILRHELAAAQEIAEHVLRQLGARGLALSGMSEVAIEWSESTDHGHLRCRGMLDHLRIDDALIFDLKIVHDATPDHVERSAESYGYAIQAAAYRRAIERLSPHLVGRVDFLFAFCEPTPPYAMNLCRPDGAFRELGAIRWERAVNTWARCLATKTWPAFGLAANNLGVPVWALRKESL